MKNGKTQTMTEKKELLETVLRKFIEVKEEFCNILSKYEDEHGYTVNNTDTINARKAFAVSQNVIEGEWLYTFEHIAAGYQ